VAGSRPSAPSANSRERTRPLREQASKESLLAPPLRPYTQALLAATPTVDPAERKHSSPVRDELPSPLNRPLGCAFASRCPYAAPRCTAEAPSLRLLEGHLVACHFAEQISD